MADTGFCQSCGKAWKDHDGIMLTCAENARLRAKLAEVPERTYLVGQIASGLIAKGYEPSGGFGTVVDVAIAYADMVIERLGGKNG